MKKPKKNMYESERRNKIKSEFVTRNPTICQKNNIKNPILTNNGYEENTPLISDFKPYKLQ